MDKVTISALQSSNWTIGRDAAGSFGRRFMGQL
jgi:hypothetical protein